MRNPRVVLGAVLAAGAASALTGCVERKLVIRSDPPGAVLFLEDEEVPQTTPVEIPFDFDGVRRVRLQAPGHAVLETTAAIESRWYDWFPLDVFAQFLWPGTIVDEQAFDFPLEPYHMSNLTPEQLADARERLAALKLRAADYRAGGAEGPASAREVPAENSAGVEEEPPPPPPPASEK